MDQLEQLKALLLSEDRAELEHLKQQLQQRLDDIPLRTEEVAAILPAAIELSAKQNQTLINALSEPVSEGLKRSIEKEPKYYGNILYPVLAPAIRKAIAQAMSSLLVTIQRTLESTTSASGISLRVKSIVSGIPYAELALLSSLIFKVEHVYLIESDTGILIKQLSDSSAKALDSDAVGAMFSAIEHFVTDSFSGDEDDRLTDLKVGERTVWVGHGPKLMLACVIFGDAPESFKTDLYETLERIRVAYSAELNQANAGELVMEHVENHLEPILQSQEKESTDTPSNNVATIVVGVALAGLMAYGLYHAISSKFEFDSVKTVFAQQAGMLVTTIDRVDDRYVVSGLRDPEAQIPFTELAALGVSPQQVKLNTRPFLSLEPEVEVRRLVKQLSLPAGVQVVHQDGLVQLLGTASLDWAEKHSSALASLVRDGRLSLSGFEVSAQSVQQVLRRDLGDDILAGAVLKPAVIDGLNIYRVVGELSKLQSAALSRYFATSMWVYVDGLGTLNDQAEQVLKSDD